MTNGKQKGKVGELEFSHLLRGHGLRAWRGQQFKGGPGSADVECPDLHDVHFEVKRREAGNLYEWLTQALVDNPKAVYHIVAHRKNSQAWVAILPMEELLRLLILREKTLT